MKTGKLATVKVAGRRLIPGRAQCAFWSNRGRDVGGPPARMIGQTALKIRELSRRGAVQTGSSGYFAVGANFESIGDAHSQSYAEARSDAKAAPEPEAVFDARLARRHRVTARNKADGAAARDTSARLAAGRSQSGRQVGVGCRFGARLSADVPLERLSTLPLEHACPRTAEPDRREETVLLAQS